MDLFLGYTIYIVLLIYVTNYFKVDDSLVRVHWVRTFSERFFRPLVGCNPVRGQDRGVGWGTVPKERRSVVYRLRRRKRSLERVLIHGPFT